MIRNWVKILFYVVLILLSIFVWEKVKTLSFFKADEVKTTHNIVIREIVSLGKMELVKYSFRDVVEQEIIRDFLPDPKAILIVQGVAVGCIDLSKITEKDLASSGDTLVINLPNPEICYHKIDHSKSKIYKTDYAFMNEAVLLDEAYRKAEEQILKSALDSDILEQTKKNADLILKPLIENISSKKVVIKYPLSGDLKRLK
ncbi:DUF4230 domain-containing protein [Lacihabitans soyangensis]|uniref:DUF4230 domain-containing protein n=1 Tax=Lacihabitans soyangensis TaxID=869394 RepID=A0AAE3H4Y8_9BACT|nr:DUF4230 domain-containing protein [Lacihabitans soyangensis]MCP9763110.1 DUF4230 domain-containing protein [Lacihabitans soyangensis]